MVYYLVLYSPIHICWSNNGFFILKKNNAFCADSAESVADFLELALQFGMIMMFACAFPLIFCFAALVWDHHDCFPWKRFTKHHLQFRVMYSPCIYSCLVAHVLVLKRLSSWQNNITEIRADALKLLVMLKRPVPRAAATIGAWLNIFQVC